MLTATGVVIIKENMYENETVVTEGRFQNMIEHSLARSSECFKSNFASAGFSILEGSWEVNDQGDPADDLCSVLSCVIQPLHWEEEH